MTELQLVSDKEQIRQNISEFNTQARSNHGRALSILRQTTYWIYDEEECVFGPNKFVGYQNMNFETYERALADNNPQFDGNFAKRGIEATLLMGEFYGNGGLHEALLNWGEELLGNEVFDSVDQSKWKFLSLFPSRRFWAFLANPKHYRIVEAVRQLTEDYWTVRDKDVEKGDRVAIWKAKGKDSNRGIVALAEVISSPRILPLPEELKKYVLNEEISAPQRRVRVRYFLTPKLPLWMEGASTDSVLRRLTVSRSTGGSLFKIKLREWIPLMKLAGGWPKSLAAESHSEQDLLFAVSEAIAKNQGGQGFTVDPFIRKTIEEYAVSLGKTHFETDGYKVEIVGKPYDLLCRRGAETLYVEVKGTQTTGDEIILTRNEVEFANRNSGQMVLFIVRNIVVTRTAEGGHRASEGEVVIERNWRPGEAHLIPLTYSYRFAKAVAQRTS